MKRVYKGSDLIFNIILDGMPANSQYIKLIDFKFYTTNQSNYIQKTDKDIDTNNQLIIESNELSKLEEGQLRYEYVMLTIDETMSDGTRDTIGVVETDYYIESEAASTSGQSIQEKTIEWGNIKGDINLQTDLLSKINQKQDKLVSGKNISTINGQDITTGTDINLDNNYYTKPEVYTKDEIDKKQYLTSHQDISGKLDKSQYDLDKVNYATKDQLNNKANESEVYSAITDTATRLLTDINKKADKIETDTKISTKADKSELNTKLDKSEFIGSLDKYDTQISQKVDKIIYDYDKKRFATKDDVVLKANASDVYKKGEVYNKSQVYTKDDVYTKGEVYSIDEVYNKSQVYTKGEVYTKPETYSKVEIDNMTNNVSKQKQDKLVSGENICTINGSDITQGGNIYVSGGASIDKAMILQMILDEIIGGVIINCGNASDK